MRVLLVDHDSEALENISRAIRGVLELDCVTSKGDALLLLRQNTYDVLIACERCVDGSGLDLLARTTRTTVPLKRIFAAATERLQLLGPRLAPFKVQRTISYPIDLEELWLAIAQVTSKRVAGYEKVPTLKEAGYDVPEVPQARGLIAPPKIPAAAVAYYEAVFQKLSTSPAWRKVLKDNLLEGAYLNSKDTIAFLGDYEKQLRIVLKQAGATLVR